MAQLTSRTRKEIPTSKFALPGRRYPIEDASHARNALARVSGNGTPIGKGDGTPQSTRPLSEDRATLADEMKIYIGISNPEATQPGEVVGCYETLPTFTRADLDLPFDEFARRYLQPSVEMFKEKYFPKVDASS